MVKNKPDHILVVRLSAMGDVAMTVPVLLGLRTKYPEVNITVLTKPFFATILRQIPNITIVEADVKGKHNGFFGLWKLYKQLQLHHIDKVADLHHVLRSRILVQFFRFASIPVVQIDKGRAAKKKLIDPNRTSFKPLKTTFERYCDVFTALGLPLHPNELQTLPKKSLTFDLDHIIDQPKKILLGIAPFAAYSGKTYPLNLMKQVVETLDKMGNYSIVLFGGGKNEVDILKHWEQQYSHILQMAGVLTFADELVLISNLDLMVAMDSGNAHLAAMYGVPTVTLWGLTHPYAGFYPYGQPETNALLADRNLYPNIPTSIYGNKVTPGYENVMSTITPDTVVVKIRELTGRLG